MIKIDLKPVAEDLAAQLKNLVPVRTGRLRDSISYRIDRRGDDYYISLIMEDYIAWLKPKTKPSRLPSPRELAMANPPLPKMNDLKLKGVEQLSPRSQGIFRKLDIESAFDELDLSELDNEIRKILAYDGL